MVKNFFRPIWAFSANCMQGVVEPDINHGLGFNPALAKAQIMQASSDTQASPVPAVVEASGDSPNTRIEDYLIDMTKELVAPDFRFQIDGVQFCPSGGITAVSGQAKQGKSQFLLVLIATLLSGKEFGNLKRLKPCQSILWIDTEQSKYDVQSNMKRLYHLVGIPEKTDAAKIHLHIAHLRDCSPEQRLQIIGDGLDKFKPDTIIIDGIRDLLHNFNDERESEEVIQWLLTISAAFQGSNIFCVLHNNPGDNKMRGHLGSELLNKCTDRFTVSKETGYFKVTHQSRHMELQGAFTFKIDEHGQLAPFNEFDTLGDMGETSEDILKSIFEESGESELYFDSILKTYAKRTGLSQKRAKQAIIDCNRKHDGQLLQSVGRGKFKLSV